MKKITLLFAVLLFANLGFGQWEFGPRIGLNFSTISGQNGWGETDQSWIVGRVIGGVAQYNVNDNFSVVGELLHITSGGKFSFDYSDDVSRSINSSNNYWKEIYSNIQLPILAKYTFGEDFQFYGNLGPYFNFNLGGRYKEVWGENNEESGKIRFGDYPDNYNGEDWYLNKDDFRRFDIGMYFGAGVQRQLGPGKLALDLRFGLGFLDFNKFENESDKPDGYEPYKNRNISLSVAYMFAVNSSE